MTTHQDLLTEAIKLARRDGRTYTSLTLAERDQYGDRAERALARKDGRREYVFATEYAAHAKHRALISQGVSVSLVAYDTARERYVFDAAQPVDN